MMLRSALLRASVAAACLTAASGAQALKVNLIDIGGVTAGTDAYNGFSAAAKYWESVIADDVTVNFRVGFTTAGFSSPTVLGQASSRSGLVNTTTWKSALTADATTALDASVVANLAPVQSTSVRLNNTVQKALGLYNGTLADDATITFNAARAFDFDTRDGFTGNSSDFVSVAVHEMGHALGFTSAVGQRTTNASIPSNMDLFRYKNGTWDITWDGDPYFSIDGGATEYLGNAGFSAGPDGFQTSHWREGSRNHDGVNCTTLNEPQVGILDPTGGICQIGIVTAQDLAAMDALGWNLKIDILQQPNYAFDTRQIIQAYIDGVPEPATWGMMILGFGMVGFAARRRPAIVAA